MLTYEGFRLVSLTALLAVMILVGAAFRTLVGNGRRRQRVMVLGTLGGMAFGILIAPPLSSWFGAEVSAITALIGIVLGWAVAWQFIKRIPRTAN